MFAVLEWRDFLYINKSSNETTHWFKMIFLSGIPLWIAFYSTILSKRLRAVLWALFLVPTLLCGQPRSVITGSVADEHNRPLPNVSLFFKQAKRGTVTNSDGQFRLRLPETGDTLTYRVRNTGRHTHSARQAYFVHSISSRRCTTERSHRYESFGSRAVTNL